MKKIGFIINPVAGMGGAVGLKGTNGDTHLRALELGAKPVTPQRAEYFLSEIKNQEKIFLLTAPSIMGEDVVKKTAINYSSVGSIDISKKTTAEDTKRIIREMLEKTIDLLVFVGGDGTSRDVYDVVGSRKPVLGVPSGVKMFSSVFAVNANAAAEVVDAFVEGNVSLVEKEVLDINEEAFRQSKLDVNLYGYLKVPVVKGLVQASKEPSRSAEIHKDHKKGIARYIVETMDKHTLYLLGPGTTTKAITDELLVDKTLLGVDAVCDGKLIDKDLNENGILKLLKDYEKTKLVLSPIGGQGFIFGRGNQEFSPKVIKSIGKENIIVVATASKINNLDCLRVDTGSFEVDRILKSYIKVITNYNEEVLIKVI